MVPNKRHPSLCCPFADADKLCVRMACVNFLQSVWIPTRCLATLHIEDAVACLHKPCASLAHGQARAMYISFADIDEQPLHVMVSSESKLQGMTCLFEDDMLPQEGPVVLPHCQLWVVLQGSNDIHDVLL